MALYTAEFLSTAIPMSFLFFTQPISPMSTRYPLSEIAAAQAAGSIMAFDRGHLQRTLARRQQIYVSRLAQSEALSHAFDEGNVEIRLRSDTQNLILHLGEAAAEIYPALRDALDEQLRSLESEIIQLHLELEQAELDETKYPSPGPDYVPDIVALCTQAAAQPEMPTHTPTPQVPRRAGAVATSAGFGFTSATATAAAA